MAKKSRERPIMPDHPSTDLIARLRAAGNDFDSYYAGNIVGGRRVMASDLREAAEALELCAEPSGPTDEMLIAGMTAALEKAKPYCDRLKAEGDGHAHLAVRIALGDGEYLSAAYRAMRAALEGH
jgi:hypothetical protein